MVGGELALADDEYVRIHHTVAPLGRRPLGIPVAVVRILARRRLGGRHPALDAARARDRSGGVRRCTAFRTAGAGRAPARRRAAPREPAPRPPPRAAGVSADRGLSASAGRLSAFRTRALWARPAPGRVDERARHGADRRRSRRLLLAGGDAGAVAAAERLARRERMHPRGVASIDSRTR